MQGYGHGHGHGFGRGSSRDDSQEERLGRIYDHRVVMRLMAYAKPYKSMLLFIMLTMLFYTGTSVALPLIIGMGISGIVGDDASVSRLSLAVILFFLTVGVGFVTQLAYLRSLARLGQNVLYDLRTDLFNHTQSLSMSFFDKSEVGRIMSRIQNDVQQLQEFFSIIILTLADILTILAIITAMIIMKWNLALLVLTVVPLLVLTMLLWQRYAWRSFMRVRRAIASLNANLQENISGVRVIQSLNREKQNLQNFQKLNYKHLDANIKASRLSAAIHPVVEMLTAVAFALVIIFGGLMVLNDTIGVEVLVVFALFIQRFFEPIRNLTMQYASLQRAMTSGSHIFELLDEKPKVVDKLKTSDLPKLKGQLKLEKVSFYYEPDVPILKEIDLHISAGMNVAIVGPTGAGKTTLVSLLMRLYDVTGGRIMVDGMDLRDIRRSFLARQIGTVLQEPFLFSGTIKENIRFSHTEVTDEQIVKTSKVIGAHQFIAKLNDGYDTVLEERGNNLSPGQRQLISIVRAMVADPSIVILDEATATVDSYTESLIHQGLVTLLNGRTAIIIAHRLSTIRNADHIIVIDQGCIVEEGNHQQLLQKKDLYARLYSLNYGQELMV